MKSSRWSAVAVLALLPFGAALADYADPSATPPAAIVAQRTVEHESFVESAHHALKAATRTSRELAVALENARRNQDMLLVTCLNDALETSRTAHADAVALLAKMAATKSAAQARALAGEINRINQLLNSALQNASGCEGDDEEGDGVQVLIDDSESSTLDPATNNPDVFSPTEPPPASVPPVQPPTVDVMEPGTDMPMTPPAASPMR